MTYTEGLILDKKYPGFCAIDMAHHVAESLGSPLKLPSSMDDNLSADWAATESNHADLLRLFELMKGCEYKEAYRDNTCNNQSDLNNFMVFTVYAPAGCPDWAWARDTFVVVERGSGGDPRYSAYGAAEVYSLDDTTVAECGFLDLQLSWWLEPIGELYDPSLLDDLNDRLSAGYSSSPFYQLEECAYAPPVWSEQRQGYIVRPKGVPYACRAVPVLPAYGG